MKKYHQAVNALALITDNIDVWTSAIKKRNGVGRGGAASSLLKGKIELTGIKKLREFILELAVRGKLVPQDPNDEPASVLLEKIAQEKAQLIEDKKIKKTKVLPVITDEDELFELPSGWKHVRLGNIGIIFNGNSVNARLKEEKYTGLKNGLPFIATKDVDYGYKSLDYDNGVLIPADEPKFKVAHKNAVLVCAEGGSAGKKCGIADQDICFGNKLFANELHADLNSKFILYTYLSPTFYSQFSKSMTGIIGGISSNKFSRLVVSLPPLPEQHRIVAKVDELMALCDQLEQQTEESLSAHQTLVEVLLATLTKSNSAVTSPETFQTNWQRIADHFDLLFTTEHSIEQLKQTILQLAVMGKLVPQNPNDEPASILLEKIAAEKAQLIAGKNLSNKRQKQKPLPAISDDEKMFELPSGWEWTRLPEIGELARGKSKHRPRNDPKLYYDGNIKLIQTGDVARSNGVIETYTAFYNETGLAQSRLWLKGTMCITIAANIADTGVLGFDACFPDSVVGFVPFINEIDVKYFDYFIRTAKSNLEAYAPSTAQKNINLEILGQLLVPLPPLNELNNIVAKVDELMALCDQLKSHLTDAQTTQLHLADAVVSNALTEQTLKAQAIN